MKESLNSLGLTYVDLYLDHWSYNFFDDKETGKQVGPVPLHVFWPMMEDLVNKGLTKSIGVSNYNVQLLSDLLSFAKIKPVVNQFECHPYLTSRELVKYCNSVRVYVMVYNSLCRGDYTKGQITKQLNLLEDPEFKKVAEKYNTTTGFLALNWALSQDILVIPSTNTPNRMKENLQALNFKISKEDLNELHEQLNKNYRFNEPKTYDWTKGIDIFA
jgi:diketogulonate reductase-like aldo/keto reductase